MGLAFYWPVLFVASHVPLPGVVKEAEISDKTLHFAAYFVLVFLFWGAVKPYEKVRWRQATVWWVLVVVVWYGAADEWLQGFVRGRTVDAGDFYADLSATVTSLILLSVVTFWTAFLLVTALVIFLVAVCSQADLNRLIPLANMIFHLAAFAFFTGLWVLYRAKCRRDRVDRTASVRGFLAPAAARGLGWWLHALGLPLLLLVLIKITAVALGKAIAWREVSSALAGMVAMAACLRLAQHAGDRL